MCLGVFFECEYAGGEVERCVDLINVRGRGARWREGERERTVEARARTMKVSFARVIPDDDIVAVFVAEVSVIWEGLGDWKGWRAVIW